MSKNLFMDEYQNNRKITIENHSRSKISESKMKVIKLLGRCVLSALKYADNSKTNLSFNNNTIVIDKNEVITGTLNGGLNGNGNWYDYFKALSVFVNILEKSYGISAWVINLESDSIDDVFYVTFGFKFNGNLSDNLRVNYLIEEFYNIIEREETIF